MDVYRQAASLIPRILSGQSTAKSACLGKEVQKKKQTYAVVCETIRNLKRIKKIIADAQFFEYYPHLLEEQQSSSSSGGATVDETAKFLIYAMVFDALYSGYGLNTKQHPAARAITESLSFLQEADSRLPKFEKQKIDFSELEESTSSAATGRGKNKGKQEEQEQQQEQQVEEDDADVIAASAVVQNQLNNQSNSLQNSLPRYARINELMLQVLEQKNNNNNNNNTNSVVAAAAAGGAGEGVVKKIMTVQSVFESLSQQTFRRSGVSTRRGRNQQHQNQNQQKKKRNQGEEDDDDDDEKEFEPPQVDGENKDDDDDDDDAPVHFDTHIPNLLVFPAGTDLHAHPLVKRGVLILQDKASCLPSAVLCDKVDVVKKTEHQKAKEEERKKKELVGVASDDKKNSNDDDENEDENQDEDEAEEGKKKKQQKPTATTKKKKKQKKQEAVAANNENGDDSAATEAVVLPPAVANKEEEQEEEEEEEKQDQDEPPRDLKDFDIIVDACAAPGNKTLQLAEYASSSSSSSSNENHNRHPVITAIERDQKRFHLLQQRTTSLGATNELIQCRNRSFQNYFFAASAAAHAKTVEKRTQIREQQETERGRVHALLLDPSCSSSGVVSRLDISLNNNDNKNNKEALEKVKALAEEQLEILTDALTRFPNATRVVYSTCSVNQMENEEVVLKALQAANKAITTANSESSSSSENSKKQQKWSVSDIMPTQWKTRGRIENNTAIAGVHANLKNQEIVARCCIRCDPAQDKTSGFFVARFDR